MKRYYDADVLVALSRALKNSTLQAEGDRLGFSPQFLCDVRLGRRPVTESLALMLGFKRVTYYERD